MIHHNKITMPERGSMPFYFQGQEHIGGVWCAFRGRENLDKSGQREEGTMQASPYGIEGDQLRVVSARVGCHVSCRIMEGNNVSTWK
jgi:hypothetical protein